MSEEKYLRSELLRTAKWLMTISSNISGTGNLLGGSWVIRWQKNKRIAQERQGDGQKAEWVLCVWGKIGTCTKQYGSDYTLNFPGSNLKLSW